jgi:hypothetical protein
MAAAILMVGLLAGVSRAQTTGGLTGSGHDFVKNGGTWNKTGEMCLPCHIPHLKNSTFTTYKGLNGIVDSQGNLVGAPLWNHQLSALDANTYTIFVAWTTTSNVVAGVTQSASATPTNQGTTVDQNTKLCLGCHDGTVALSNFNVPHGETAGDGTTTMTTFASFAVKGAGNDLTATHPIGSAALWTYPTDTTKWVDPSLRDAKGIMPLRPMATGQMAVGCSSCHDPHGTAGNNDFLWIPNNVAGTTVDGRSVSGSVLCENCHVK